VDQRRPGMSCFIKYEYQDIKNKKGVNSYVFSLFATEDALYIGGEFSGYYQVTDPSPPPPALLTQSNPILFNV